jgi:hypothetical protein
MSFREGRFRTPPEFNTGREHEYSLFDQVDVNAPEFVAQLKKYAADSGNRINRRDAIQLAKDFQPGDPEQPTKQFFNDLRIEIMDKLDDADIDAEVKAYTAVNTPLDIAYGTDAFITIEVDGREHVVTLDATINPEKLSRGHKADILVGNIPEPNEGPQAEEQYLETVEQIAALAIKELRNKMSGGIQTYRAEPFDM